MSFKEVTPLLKPSAPQGAIRFRVVATPKGALYASLSIPLAIVAELGLAKGDHFKLLVGEGSDTGWIRIVRDDTGPLTLSMGQLVTRSASIRLGNFEGMPKGAVAPRPVKHSKIARGFDAQVWKALAPTAQSGPLGGLMR